MFRPPKRLAGEEWRSRQYKGTAMSHDKASKVPLIMVFDNTVSKTSYKTK